ncbi:MULTISPECIES: PPOX class F420-dependent oxidoreductase [Mycolicibacterium]|uniref:Pyridoxamine 5'-phosphate oxidase-related, FMN-binding protein n=2 Tax=Mycolicibacterium TaxID=1866885 RepID=A1TFD7_MYCVP|nr:MULTISPECIES: PPOX class F420-dependent oxidoreductase [Mycolicibacterium]ABM15887.1 pyridoxamine 5'-phosphate oxidase-related, FMN-binding protein [Mycolicibacterium vanbaalenii PYR-1]MCV7128979.1 PPOX class F420-dependent oxidoreductase [Mycolicibacterium vanbaalenii PYR-1]MDN4518041.1 PPOX class F420-dependent oxidoreductase [Mycolicibacterium austroafricanum]PQP43256.1 PPOX class F420-dependent oxidoreductase [Mycolicibacterium austroafricanum]QRZ06199.1 PPOX class F420-dependent oxidor
MTFTTLEIDFMKQADLGRLATIQPDGTPQNSPVGFTYNEQLGTIDIAGYEMAKSRKYRNLADNDRVALVVDDITPRDPLRTRGAIQPLRTRGAIQPERTRGAIQPERVRCLEIRGTAVQAEDGGRPIIRVTPRRVISFGIDDQETEPHQLVAHVRNVGVEQQVPQRLPLR